MKLATGAGCPPWKTLSDREFQYHTALKGDSRGRKFSRRPVKSLGLLLSAAGQAPSAPNNHRLASCCSYERDGDFGLLQPQPDLPLPASSRKPRILKFCRDGAEGRKVPTAMGAGRAASSLPSEGDLPRAALRPGGGMETSHHHPDALWGLGGGAAVDSVKFPKQAPFPQWILLAWLVAPRDNDYVCASLIRSA